MKSALLLFLLVVGLFWLHWLGANRGVEERTWLASERALQAVDMQSSSAGLLRMPQQVGAREEVDRVVSTAHDGRFVPKRKSRFVGTKKKKKQTQEVAYREFALHVKVVDCQGVPQASYPVKIWERAGTDAFPGAGIRSDFAIDDSGEGSLVLQLPIARRYAKHLELIRVFSGELTEELISVPVDCDGRDSGEVVLQVPCKAQVRVELQGPDGSPWEGSTQLQAIGSDWEHRGWTTGVHHTRESVAVLDRVPLHVPFDLIVTPSDGFEPVTVACLPITMLDLENSIQVRLSGLSPILEGRILDADLNPVVGSAVQLQWGYRTVGFSTDRDGGFRLSLANLAQANGKISVSREGRGPAKTCPVMIPTLAQGDHANLGDLVLTK